MDTQCRDYTCCGLNLTDLHALVDHFDLIINTTSAELKLDGFMRMLHRDGTFVEAGVPEHSLTIHPFSVLFQLVWAP